MCCGMFCPAGHVVFIYSKRVDKTAIYVFFNIHDLLPRPASYIKSSHKSFEINKIMFGPHLRTFIDVWELIADTKLSIVICSQIFDRKSTAPSSGKKKYHLQNFRQQIFIFKPQIKKNIIKFFNVFTWWTVFKQSFL